MLTGAYSSLSGTSTAGAVGIVCPADGGRPFVIFGFQPRRMRAEALVLIAVRAEVLHHSTDINAFHKRLFQDASSCSEGGRRDQLVASVESDNSVMSGVFAIGSVHVWTANRSLRLWPCRRLPGRRARARAIRDRAPKKV